MIQGKSHHQSSPAQRCCVSCIEDVAAFLMVIMWVLRQIRNAADLQAYARGARPQLNSPFSAAAQQGPEVEGRGAHPHISGSSGSLNRATTAELLQLKGNEWEVRGSNPHLRHLCLYFFFFVWLKPLQYPADVLLALHTSSNAVCRQARIAVSHSNFFHPIISDDHLSSHHLSSFIPGKCSAGEC